MWQTTMTVIHVWQGYHHIRDNLQWLYVIIDQDNNTYDAWYHYCTTHLTRISVQWWQPTMTVHHNWQAYLHICDNLQWLYVITDKDIHTYVTTYNDCTSILTITSTHLWQPTMTVCRNWRAPPHICDNLQWQYVMSDKGITTYVTTYNDCTS
jgi:hypothetical protein